MDMKGYWLVPLNPHAPPAEEEPDAQHNVSHGIARMACMRNQLVNTTATRVHTVVVGAGAVGRAVPGGLGREPAAAGAAELADGGGGVVRWLRAGAMRDKHGEEPNNEGSCHRSDQLCKLLAYYSVLMYLLDLCCALVMGRNEASCRCSYRRAIKQLDGLGKERSLIEQLGSIGSRRHIGRCRVWRCRVTWPPYPSS
jgi:hypothetical protein